MYKVDGSKAIVVLVITCFVLVSPSLECVHFCHGALTPPCGFFHQPSSFRVVGQPY